MRLPIVFGTAALSILGVVAMTSTAHAQDPAQPAAAAKPAEAPQKAEEEHKKISLEINPLAATIGRYSLQVEYLPAVHHALVLNPHFTHVPVTATVNGKEIDGGSLTGFGGELGYRYYTGTKGPNGFFIGPSFLFSSYSQELAGKSDSFTAIGGALDIGGQAVIGPGIVIGGGFGLQYTSNSKDIGDTDGLNLASAIIAGGGVRPRFLLSLGYAF